MTMERLKRTREKRRRSAMLAIQGDITEMRRIANEANIAALQAEVALLAERRRHDELRIAANTAIVAAAELLRRWQRERCRTPVLRRETAALIREVRRRP